jgi:hypothetical protein
MLRRRYGIGTHPGATLPCSGRRAGGRGRRHGLPVRESSPDRVSGTPAVTPSPPAAFPDHRSSSGYRLILVIDIATVPVRHLGDAPPSLGRRAIWDKSRGRSKLALGAAKLVAGHGVLACARRFRADVLVVVAASGERVKSFLWDHARLSRGPTVPPRSAPRRPGDPGRYCPRPRRSVAELPSKVQIAAATGRGQDPHSAGARGSGK